jgi:acyl dehydratase
MTVRYFEDFVVGQTFSSGRTLVEREQIKRFASEFDPQPFHLDENTAQDTIFRGLAASGWHTAAAICASREASSVRRSRAWSGAGQSGLATGFRL